MQQSEISLISISLVSSFIGSWHCALMCGPIAANFRNTKGLSAYQLGRMFSYILIGGLSGYLGSYLLSPNLSNFRIALGILFGLVLIFAALQQISTSSAAVFNSGNWLARVYLSALRFLKAQGFFRFPFLAGVMTALLPCAWLLTWVLAAAHSHSAFVGALLLFILWLGGVPALSALSIFIKRGHQLSSKKQKFVLFILLLICGLYSIASQILFGLGILKMS